MTSERSLGCTSQASRVGGPSASVRLHTRDMTCFLLKEYHRSHIDLHLFESAIFRLV